MTSDIHYEKYRDSFSAEIAIACDVTEMRIAASFYDLRLDVLVARSVIPLGIFNDENVTAELSKLVFMSIRTYGISAQSIVGIGCAASNRLVAILQQQLTSSDMFLPPDTPVTVLPFVSAFADSRFAAMLAAVDFQKGTLAVDFGKTLNIAYHDGNILNIASFQLKGAFDGSAFENGMPCEYGAIDEVCRENNKQICYSVVGDCDAYGIATSGVFDSVCIMLKEKILDSDGILNDRDMFYIGEDCYVSQSDIRMIQSDKAGATAALKVFLDKFDKPLNVWLGGDVLAINGLQRLIELGVLPQALAANAHYCRSYTEQGIIRCYTEKEKLQQLHELIYNAVDITSSLYDRFDDLYIEKLAF